ncbi:hypothetical protein [Flagellimonas sp. CMM7]|uniref:hypothetical protein n=1 Tax=Flagellimonas sp. CMM7 TaxID=2654676 RepID=UPI001969A4C5|nr:hypothetical protein [Flagellimonas sp. CMM7]UII80125.1 hypothetical protein LV704_01060 [Flagellimonas sp. CMM7]
MAILILVTYQDMKMRLIHVMLPIAIFVLGVSMNWVFAEFAYLQWIWSLLFLVFNFAIVAIYFSVKNGKYTNPFDTLIGWGDVLFLIALIPLFSFGGYIRFFVLGMVFSLLLFGIMKTLYPKYRTIPLAGFLAIFLIGTTLVNHITDLNLLL